MEKNLNKNQVPTNEELESILSSNTSYEDKGWAIYRFLKANIGEKLPSQESRRLLSAYLGLQLARPSLLHSLMLGIAIRMADTYPDFRLSRFIDIWNIQTLRFDDYKRQTDKQNRTFHSLAERLTACVLLRMIANPTEEFGEDVMALVGNQAPQLGYLPILPMVAVKMFESELKGRKMRMVKLIGPQGEELSADWHLFHAKPWEIVGKMYRVLPRRSEKSGNVRVVAIGAPTTDIADEFGKVIGYVESFDEKHKHYHIYDNTSRHFVAESPTIRIKVGDYVWIAPIVPAEDPFKSAVVLGVETKERGREAFGPVYAKVKYINTEKGYFGYTTSDGQTGFGLLKTAAGPLVVEQEIKMTIFLRRGRDGEKRPRPADVY